MTDYSELKRLADAATPGPWRVCSGSNGGPGFEIIQDLWDEDNFHIGNDVVANELGDDDSDPLGVASRADADYIAAACPATVLSMIAERDQLKAECASLRKDAERYRWLRAQEAEHGVCIINVGEWTAGATCIATTFHSAEFADEMVDAAMSKEIPT